MISSCRIVRFRPGNIERTGRDRGLRTLVNQRAWFVPQRWAFVPDGTARSRGNGQGVEMGQCQSAVGSRQSQSQSPVGSRQSQSSRQFQSSAGVGAPSRPSAGSVPGRARARRHTSGSQEPGSVRRPTELFRRSVHDAVNAWWRPVDDAAAVDVKARGATAAQRLTARLTTRTDDSTTRTEDCD